MKERLTFQMRQLAEGLTKGSFEGFTLQKGYWYGYNFRGQPVATSGWIKDGHLIMYRKMETGIWQQESYSPEAYQKFLPKVMIEAIEANA